MKKILLISLFLVSLSFAFNFNSTLNSYLPLNNIVVKFEGTNGNGNNLWIDNFYIGSRYANDLTITGISVKDKNYFLPGVSSTSVSPEVTVYNAGSSASGAATVTMIAVGTTYNVTKNVPAINGGFSSVITFDPMTFDVDVTKNLKVYVTYATDQNHSNDTLYQPSTFHAGIKRKVLFEAHTSTTCGPCASQNPALDAFIQQKFDSAVAIKYHVWWPSLGDPMYGANIPQQRVRTHYNSISAVPTLQVDGVLQQVSGYTTLSNLTTPFNARMSKGTPIALSVTDTRLPGDSIKATIQVQVLSPISTKTNLRLRISAIERKIQYSSPPGSNGETIFYDVFRRMYPSSDGASINITPGTHTYTYTYKREAAWIDSMIYTTAVVQDEYTHDVYNAARGRNYYDNPPISGNGPVINLNNQFYNDNPNPVTYGMQFETMEVSVPPPGWSITNMDSSYTFWMYRYTSVNGPSLAGSRSIRINYYSYPENIGTLDILTSKAYNDVNSNDTISFDYAYGNRTGLNDRLVVKVSTDGGTTFPYTVFDKQGAALATAGTVTSGFVPSSASQWGIVKIPVASFLTGINPNAGTVNKYELSQNYPNPFNPMTTIQFQVPSSKFVKLIVFDLLGKEVKTLVNEVKTAGSYSVSFDAAGLSSGVYFYKMTAGDFSDVKRMVLIK